jgi:hypothetical protein
MCVSTSLCAALCGQRHFMPSTETRLNVCGFTVTELMLNQNKPRVLIRQSRRAEIIRSQFRKQAWSYTNDINRDKGKSFKRGLSLTVHSEIFRCAVRCSRRYIQHLIKNYSFITYFAYAIRAKIQIGKFIWDILKYEGRATQQFCYLSNHGLGMVTVSTTSFNIKHFIIDSTECIEAYFGCEVKFIVDVSSLAQE